MCLIFCVCGLKIQDGHHHMANLTWNPMGKSCIIILSEISMIPQQKLECLSDGPLRNVCFSVNRKSKIIINRPREDEKIILIESRLYMNSQWRIPYKMSTFIRIGNSIWQAPQPGHCLPTRIWINSFLMNYKQNMNITRFQLLKVYPYTKVRGGYWFTSPLDLCNKCYIGQIHEILLRP